MRQETINAMLVTKATEYDVVVRLKGGDPFVFGRGGEEALALVSAGVPWEVVPGVSAGSAVAAYAGIPITHRGMSSSVAFVTGHEDPAKTESGVNWGRLARGADTLVIFMGVNSAAEMAERLMAHGLGGETPAAVISRGTYEHQECHVAALAELAHLIEARAVTAPAIIVIGEVVRLRDLARGHEVAVMDRIERAAHDPDAGSAARHRHRATTRLSDRARARHRGGRRTPPPWRGGGSRRRGTTR